MLYRALAGLGLLVLGYYVGREIGRAEIVRKKLEKKKMENSPNPNEDSVEKTSHIHKTEKTVI